MSMYGVEYSGIDCGTEGGAKQSFKEECDINTIVAQYAKTGLLTPVVQRPPEFVDVSEVGDYRTALEHVRIADDMFMQLGSAIRGEFENDPAIFLDFCTDPQNEDRMRELGLLPSLEEAVVTVDGPPAEPAVADSGD